jgi:SOS-response transcriptional repressor LexA
MIERFFFVMSSIGRLPVGIAAVPAGSPFEPEDCADWFSLDELLNIKIGTSFGLRVTGDSMIPRIEPGDWLLVERCDIAPIGQIVVADVAGEGWVVKRLKGNSRLKLISDNKNYPPITTEFKIMGWVRHIIKEAR